MKYMYLVDFNQPFPTSDGGLIAIIASNDTECHDILLENKLWHEKYNHLIIQAVVRSQKFLISNSEEESRIVEHFIT